MTQGGFVLVHPAESQAYPLLGFLPWPFTPASQVLLILALFLLILFGVAAQKDMLRAGLGGVTGLNSTERPRVPRKQALRRSHPTSSGPITSATLLAAQQQSSSTSSAVTVIDDPKYKGLRNTGNTCFFNSTLQSISALPLFQQYLHTLVEQAEQSDTPTPVIDVLLELMHELNTPVERNGSINPTQLVRALQSLPSSSIRSLVGAHQQQDAHELFALLNETVDAEAKAVYADRSLELDATHAGLRTLMAPSLPWAGKAVRTQSLQQQPLPFPHNLFGQDAQNGTAQDSSDALKLISPFDALLAQRTTCLDCGYCEAIRHFSTSEISLSVPAPNVATPTSQLTGTSACSLTECLEMWSELEQVDWICWNCSLQSTLASIRADLTVKTPGTNGSAAHTNGAAPHSVSAAKKKRLAQLRSKESKVARILQSGLSEDEILQEAADPSSTLHGVLNGVTISKTLSRLSTKQIMLSRPPRILALHLNRSSYSASAWAPSKNNRHVLFDEFLDLTSVTLQGTINTDGRTPMNHHTQQHRPVAAAAAAQYRLAAIVVHYGSHSYGHYIAYKRVREHHWLRISDETVTHVSLAHVRTENPFMLFYERLLPAVTEMGTTSAARSTRVAHPRTLHRWQSPSRAQTPVL